MSRRRVAIFAAFIVFLLGSGALMALHDFQHNLEARTLNGEHERPGTPHDESNCPVHAMLHAPLLLTGAELPPLGPAETTETVALADQSVVSADFAPNRSCRGPPTL